MNILIKINGGSLVKKVLLIPLILLPLALLLSSCAVLGNSNITLSGTIASYSTMDLDPAVPAVLTITQGKTQFSVNANVPVMDQSGNQSVSYTISGVPSGTYDVALVLTSAGLWFDTTFSAAFSVNGAAQVTTYTTDVEQVKTFTAMITITDSATVNFDLQNLG